MKVLVTGGGGFLGRYIVRLLKQQGHDVSVLGRSQYSIFHAQNIKCFQGDISQYEDILAASQYQDAIIHVAAKAGIWGPWREYYNTNVVGTLNVIKACKHHNIKYLIHTSTPSVVFNGEAFEGADESLSYGKNALCHYACTKAIAEKAVLESHDGINLNTIALRPHLIFGPEDTHLIPTIIQRAKKRRLIQVGEGTNLVDITYVENAAWAHILALNALLSKRTGGKAYFISQDQPVNLWQWLRELLEKLNLPPITKKVPFKTAYYLGYSLEKLFSCFPNSWEPSMTRFVAVELAKSHYFNISAAKRDLDYTPIISTGEALQRTIEFFK